MLGIFYVIFPISILIFVREHIDMGFIYIIWCFIVVWSIDIVSYLCGSYFRGPLLFKSISPNKTWSGFSFGFLASILSGYSGAHLLGINIFYGIIIGCLCGLFVPSGDLFESWVKRKFNKKNSAEYIPGHGGFLDRLDGFLFAVILVWLGVIYGWSL